MPEFPTTDNHNFARPDVTVDDLEGTWGDVINQDITDILEERVPIVDTAAARPNYEPYSDAVFIASDSGQVSLGNGTGWDFRGVVPNDSDVLDAIDGASITPSDVTTDSATVNGTTTTDALEAESFNGVVEVSADDDIKSKIENAGQNTHIRIESGAIFTVASGTISCPDDVVIEGMGDGVQIQKQFDGPLFEAGNFTTVKRVDFNARRQDGYTGDAVTDKDTNQRFMTFLDCTFRNAESAARRELGSKNMFYRGCYISNSDVGVAQDQNATGTGEGPRRTQYRQCEINETDTAAVKINAHVRNVTYDIRIQINNGRAFWFDAPDEGRDETSRGVRIENEIQGNDGVAILVTDGGVQIENAASIASNAGTPSNLTETPVGQIHFEGHTVDSRITEVSGKIGPSNNADSTYISQQSTPECSVIISGGEYATTDTIADARANVVILDRTEWDGEVIPRGGSRNGIALNGVDTGVIERLIPGQKDYTGVRSSPPTGDSNFSQVYFDDGANTGNSNPGWRYSASGNTTYTDV